MPKLKLVLAYDGTDFHGWARQPRVRTVEGELAKSLARILGERLRISVAGRTDAGVHAEGQVVSFEAPESADPERIARSLNGMLAPEVVVRSARFVPAGFDARHSASGREYRYRIRTEEPPDPFTARYEWHRPGSYRLGAMRTAARLLEGEHDFTSFSRRAPGVSPVRRLERLSVGRLGDRIEVRAAADGFLHQMVRSLVGTLVEVGDGSREAGTIPGVLEARSRAAAGRVAPPHGLALLRVRYGARIPRAPKL